MKKMQIEEKVPMPRTSGSPELRYFTVLSLRNQYHKEVVVSNLHIFHKFIETDIPGSILDMINFKKRPQI